MGLNLDSLLTSYKVDLSKEKNSLDPLVVLSDDEDINDYMEITNETEPEPEKPPKNQIEEQKNPDVNMATENDLKMNELTEGLGKGSGIILPLMMVSFFIQPLILSDHTYSVFQVSCWSDCRLGQSAGYGENSRVS